MKPIPEMSKDEINRELCERLKIPWHETDCTVAVNGTLACICGKVNCGGINPDFYAAPGKEQLLREIGKLPNRVWLIYGIGGYIEKKISEGYISIACVSIDMMVDQDGLLAITALEFLRKEQG